MTARRLALGLLLLAPLGACDMPAALNPGGPQASALSRLIWTFTGLCTVIWVLVVVAVLVAIWRRHSHPAEPLVLEPRTENRFRLVITTLAALTGVIVIGLTVLSYAAQQQLYSKEAASLDIEITGHQWWWEIRYQSAAADQTFITANEFHVPVGKPVRLTLTSSDVIHSFWIPSLMGKMDLIPGRENELTFTAAKPGVYAGQCAEFCGLQHAHMGIRVFADAPGDYEAWRANQVAAAPPPATPDQAAGQQALLANPCQSCHTVRGTTAGGNTGPDLTHLATRTTLAAGTLQLTRGNLAAWIVDPQGIKPGADMPVIKLEADELSHLVDYLMGLT